MGDGLFAARWLPTAMLLPVQPPPLGGVTVVVRALLRRDCRRCRAVARFGAPAVLGGVWAATAAGPPLALLLPLRTCNREGGVRLLLLVVAMRRPVLPQDMAAAAAAATASLLRVLLVGGRGGLLFGWEIERFLSWSLAVSNKLRSCASCCCCCLCCCCFGVAVHVAAARFDVRAADLNMGVAGEFRTSGVWSEYVPA